MPVTCGFPLPPIPTPAPPAFHSTWWGFKNPDTNIAYEITQKRVLRYATLVRDNPAFRIDPNRIYAEGASMGGGGAMRMAYLIRRCSPPPAHGLDGWASVIRIGPTGAPS